jgi:hypothetical protein
MFGVETERPGVPNMAARRLVGGRGAGSRWPTTPGDEVDLSPRTRLRGCGVGVGTAKGYEKGVGVW